jgi:GT2 family glycosyltransferase
VSEPAVDVVIATYNRPDALMTCLEALCNQSHRDFRVIVVDDASPVDSETVVRERFSRRLDLLWLRLPQNGGPAFARNAGVAAGSAPLVCFVDDDVVASPGLLVAHCAALRDGQRRAVSIGPLRAPRDWKPTPWNRWEAKTLEREYRRMTQGEYAPTWRQLFTGNAMLRREDFERVGGFDVRYKRAEDIELGYRLWKNQCEFPFTPFAIGWHYAERSLQSWMRIPAMYAETDLAMARAYPELDWLRCVDGEREQPLRRISRHIARLGRGGEFVRSSLLVSGRALDRIGLTAAATPFLSAVFNIGYARRRLELAGDPALPGVHPVLDAK